MSHCQLTADMFHYGHGAYLIVTGQYTRFLDC